MGDAMAHIQISTETIYDSAQRMRRLAHELLELVRLRDQVRRAEERQKARGKFGPRGRRKRVRHALKTRYRLFRANSSESLLATIAKCLDRELQWPPALDLGVVDAGHQGASFAAWPATLSLRLSTALICSPPCNPAGHRTTTHFRNDAAASLSLGRSHQTHHQRSLL